MKAEKILNLLDVAVDNCCRAYIYGTHEQCQISIENYKLIRQKLEEELKSLEVIQMRDTIRTAIDIIENDKPINPVLVLKSAISVE